MTMQANLLKKLEKARTEIFLKEPFLGYVLQQLDIVFTEKVSTAATDGLKIYFNHEYFKKLDGEQLKFILLHELMHVVLHHPSRMKGKEKQRFNIACDIVANDLLFHYGYTLKGMNVIYGKQFGISGVTQTAESIYRMLKGKVKTIVIHYSDLIITDHTETSANRIKSVVSQAIENGYNPDPHILKKRVLNINETKKKQRWTHLLHKYMKQKENDYNFDRTDHRYQDVLLPHYSSQNLVLNQAWFVVDVSGSISDEMLQTSYRAIRQTLQNVPNSDCEISFFSSEVTNPVKLCSLSKLKETFKSIKTTYGTNFKKIFEAMPTFYKGMLPSAVVIITDGRGYFPEKELALNVPVIWLITGNKKAPFGDSYALRV